MRHLVFVDGWLHGRLDGLTLDEAWGVVVDAGLAHRAVLAPAGRPVPADLMDFRDRLVLLAELSLSLGLRSRVA